MNAKSTSQPHLSTSRNEDVEKGDWYFTKPESEEKIQKFKVVVKNLPSVQKHKAHKWSNKGANKGVQSLSNLECIIENSYETDLEYIDSDAVDTSLDNYLDNINSSSTLDDSKKFMQSDKNLNRNENNSTQTNQYDKSIQSTKLLNSISTISTNSASMPLDNENRSNLNKTNSRLNSNYQSNLNMANKFANLHLPVELNKKSNYKQINTDDLSNGNYFFGPIDQEYEGRKLSERSTKNRKIEFRQNFCDYMTIFLILTAFISIFVSIVLLFLIALNAWSMGTTFTIMLIILCILTVLLVLFASFTANFVWFFNSNSNSIDWMLHYGRKRANNDESSDYYFGKSLKSSNQKVNETESSLIQQI